MFHHSTRGRHARPRRLRLPDPVVQACPCGGAAGATTQEPAATEPAAVATYGEALLGVDEPWRPTSLGPLGPDFMAQRPRMVEVTRPQPADAGTARVVSFQPTHTAPALAVEDPIRVKDGVKDYGGQHGTVFGFNCAADLSIGTQLVSGELVYFAPDEVDPAPIADTLVMGPLDLVDDLVLMGGTR